MAGMIEAANRSGVSRLDDETNTFGGSGVRAMLAGERYAELEKRMSYYDCTQHDRKYWDFDGRPINPRTLQPLMGAERAFWVPLGQRRPSTPVRLGKVIVASFSNLLFGENRFPTIRVEGDPLTEDWLQAAAKAGKLPAGMMLARAHGGAAGTAGLSWCFRDGKPQFEVHKPQNLFVHSWLNRVQLIPEHVSEVYMTKKTKWDGRAFNQIYYWVRRDWTPDAEVYFEEVPAERDKDPVWIVDWEKTVQHGDDCCHLEWIQNLPSEEQDGEPDYHGIYEKFDQIDLVMSVITRGGIKNLDPTVLLKMDRDEIGRMGIAKGSDNALVVGKDGDASYMELAGQSLESGLKLVDVLRSQILEEAQCIVPDPNEVAAQGISSVAIKAMFAPMTAKSDQHREQYGSANERVLAKMQKSARLKLSMAITVPVDPKPTAPALPAGPLSDPLAPADPLPAHPADDLVPPVVPDDTLAAPDLEPTGPLEADAQFVIDLPPKIIDEPSIDPLTGQPDGQMISKQVPRELGPGGEVTLQWPPYFAPTPADQAQIVTSLTTATGGKAVMSVETAVEAAAVAFGKDPAEEWRRVQAEGKADAAAQASMLDMGAAAGAVPHEGAPPPGAHPSPPPPPASHLDDPLPPHPNELPDAHVPVDLDLTKKK